MKKKNPKHLQKKGEQAISDENEKKEPIVTLSLPGEVSIEMVQANEVRPYELFQLLLTISFSADIGFWTAFFTISPFNFALLGISIFLLGFSALFLYLIVKYRKKIFHNSVKKKVKITDFK